MEIINYECYVSLEVAKLLKEAGFDWKQYSFYNSKGVLISGTFDANWNNKIWHIDGSKVSAPSLDVAQRWLREVKESFIGTNPIDIEYNIKWQYVIIDYEGFVCAGEKVDVYEEAQEAGIKKALEIILKKGK